MPLTIEDIRLAAGRIQAAVSRTPQTFSRTLSDLSGAQLYLKFENLQFTASFKERGALNKLLTLTAEERARGVVAMSAGNHAQGVAYHAGRLGIPATIVMPRFTPFVKVRHTRDAGARVLLEGDTLTEAAAFARKVQSEENLIFIHPYDDDAIMAGQGTIALEMLADEPDLDTLVVPIGGGGLIGGIATAAKALKPDIRVIGAEAALYPSMYHALRNEPAVCGGNTIAEGIAVKEPGPGNIEIARRLVDEIVLVDEPGLEQAVSLLVNVEKSVVEGAGAAGLAAVFARPDLFRGRRVGLPLCGGNIDSRILANILNRSLVREGRIARLRIEITDTPGELARVAGIVGQGGANIIDVSHQRIFGQVSVKSAQLRLALETRDATHMQEIVTGLRAAGYAVDELDRPRE